MTQKTAKVGIDTLIFLKHTLRQAPVLAEVLMSLTNQRDSSSSNPLIWSIITNLKDECFSVISQMIDNLLTESTSYTKNSYEV